MPALVYWPVLAGSGDKPSASPNTTMTQTPCRKDAAARVRAEGPITLAQAAALVPADTPTGHVAVATILRWIISGNKKQGRLDSAKIKGEWHTSREALGRFAAAVTARS